MIRKLRFSASCAVALARCRITLPWILRANFLRAHATNRRWVPCDLFCTSLLSGACCNFYPFQTSTTDVLGRALLRTAWCNEMNACSTHTNGAIVCAVRTRATSVPMNWARLLKGTERIDITPPRRERATRTLLISGCAESTDYNLVRAFLLHASDVALVRKLRASIATHTVRIRATAPASVC